MTEATDAVEVYQLRVWLREISPLIWRRFLVRSDSNLHYTLQIALDWSGSSGVKVMVFINLVAPALPTIPIRSGWVSFVFA